MEPWRTEAAERFVLRALNRRELRREHFEKAGDAEGVILATEGKKEFFGRWFPFMHEEARRLPGIVREVTFREAIFTHVRAFAQWLRRERDSWPLLLVGAAEVRRSKMTRAIAPKRSTPINRV